MKKIKIYLIMSVLIAASCSILTGCGKDNTKTTEVSSQGANSQELNGSENKDSSETNENTTNTAKESTIESKVLNKIKYPSFKGIKNEDKINKIVLDYVNKINRTYESEDGIEFKSEYKIMYQDDKYVSIYFTGETSGSSLAYVSKFKSTLNIDIDKAEVMRLNDITNVDNGFINSVNKGMESNLKALGVEENPYNTETIKSLLESSDENGEYISDVQSYFTKDSVVVIISVPHAIGDYSEVSIPNSFVGRK